MCALRGVVNQKLKMDAQSSSLRSLVARDLLIEEWQLVERSGATVPPALQKDYLEGDCLVRFYALELS